MFYAAVEGSMTREEDGILWAQSQCRESNHATCRREFLARSSRKSRNATRNAD
jgi:hypothetical protein